MAEDPSEKKGKWLSLLSVLLAAKVQPMDVVCVEVAPGDSFEFAFWNYDPDGIPVSYRSARPNGLWKLVETPGYTGRIRTWERPNNPRNDPPPSNDPWTL